MTDLPTLTESQACVLRILRAYMRDHGRAPTLAEQEEAKHTEKAE